MSGMAGPVIKATGIKIRIIENISTSLDMVLSKNKDLKGIDAREAVLDRLFSRY